MAAKSQTVEEKMKLALKLQADKEYSKSNKQLIDLYSTNDMKELVCLNLAKNYFVIGNLKAAKKYSAECIELNGEYAKEAAIINGVILHREGFIKEELELYSKIEKRFPTDYQIKVMKSDALYGINQVESCRSFYKSIICDPLNPVAHILVAMHETESRHYIQAILAKFMLLMTTQEPSHVREIDQMMRNRKDIKDAMQDVLYSTDTIIGKTDKQLYWSLPFINSLNICEPYYDNNKLPDAECFVENSKKLITELCNSVEANRVEEERTFSDFYIDFFAKVLENNMLEDFLYFGLLKTYPDLNDYIQTDKERINKFADFLEQFYK